MLYKEYDPQVLKKLQRAEIEILKDFDALCGRHGIEYFVCGGTSLGGVRHGGFIPWDDDIDLGMTREHYDKFLQVAEKEYGDKYKMINPEIDPDFPVMITKWYRTGTVFRNQETVDLGLHIGIAIDLFCFDRVPDDVAGLRKQALCMDLGKIDDLKKNQKSKFVRRGMESADDASGIQNHLRRFAAASYFSAVFVQTGIKSRIKIQRCQDQKSCVSV